MYFDYHGRLLHQQNMLQDYVSTGAYYAAVMENRSDFAGRVVLDVDAGSGILSLFAAQAGAKHVYAVEASEMAEHARKLIAGNPLFADRITVIKGKVEDIELPEKADVLISEPMGTLLINERMLESYVIARDRFMSPNGKMFPTCGRIHMAPFSDELLFTELENKALFWQQQNYYEVDLTSLFGSVRQEYFSQPVVDAFDPRLLVAPSMFHMIDFYQMKEEDFYEFDIPIKFTASTCTRVHGLACWFDVLFDGSTVPRWLTTAPGAPTTHWYQIRCVLPQPLYVMAGQEITGRLHLVAHSDESYTIDLTLSAKMWEPGASQGGILQSSTCTFDLKEPYYRMSQPQAQPQAQEPPTPQQHLNTQGVPVGMARKFMGLQKFVRNNQVPPRTLVSLDGVLPYVGDEIQEQIKSSKPEDDEAGCFFESTGQNFYLRIRSSNRAGVRVTQAMCHKRWEAVRVIGPVRNQFEHPLCWGFVATDTVSALRVIENLDTSYQMLNVKELCFFASPKIRKKLKGEDHQCHLLKISEGFNYIAKRGVGLCDRRDDFDCVKDMPKKSGKNIKIGGWGYIGDNISDILNQLMKQPLAASVFVFQPEFSATVDDVYCGPTASGSSFVSVHGLTVVSVSMIGGEPVFRCKSSTGETAHGDGYINVSGSTMVAGFHFGVGKLAEFGVTRVYAPAEDEPEDPPYDFEPLVLRELKPLIFDFMYPILESSTSSSSNTNRNKRNRNKSTNRSKSFKRKRSYK